MSRLSANFSYICCTFSTWPQLDVSVCRQWSVIRKWPISFILENEGTGQMKWSPEIILLDQFFSFFKFKTLPRHNGNGAKLKSWPLSCESRLTRKSWLATHLEDDLHGHLYEWVIDKHSQSKVAVVYYIAYNVSFENGIQLMPKY